MSSRRSLEGIYAARGDSESEEFREAYEETRRTYEFGVLTRALRKAAGLTQQELAARMSTTASAIARLEAGGTSPTFATLEHLATALGVRLRLEVADADANDLPSVTFGAA
ncbi:MAG: helix-turn-helix domain-containing protein [Egibacteraceae bacterium]